MTSDIWTYDTRCGGHFSPLTVNIANDMPNVFKRTGRDHVAA